MLVADTSALISLATTDVFETSLDEFEVHTTEIVVQELEETADFDDEHGTAASTVCNHLGKISIHAKENPELESSRVDRGEASCLALERDLQPVFFLTDDIRALPELQALTDAKVVISPILLRALVKREILTNEEARAQLNQLIATRNWIDTPIYRRAQDLFEE